MLLPVTQHGTKRLRCQELAVQAWRRPNEEVARDEQERSRRDPGQNDTDTTESREDASEGDIDTAAQAARYQRGGNASARAIASPDGRNPGPAECTASSALGFLGQRSVRVPVCHGNLHRDAHGDARTSLRKQVRNQNVTDSDAASECLPPGSPTSCPRLKQPDSRVTPSAVPPASRQ